MRSRKATATTVNPTALENGAQPAVTDADIAVVFANGWATIAKFGTEIDEVDKALTTARDGRVTSRSEIMRDIAKRAHAGAWSIAAIDAAVKRASTATNVSGKTLDNYLGEARRFAHPKARASVETLYAMAEAAFTSDNAAAVVAVHKRKPLWIAKQVTALVDGKLTHETIPSATTIVNEAIAAHSVATADATLAKAAIDRAVKTLKDHNEKFNNPDIATAIGLLAAITAARLNIDLGKVAVDDAQERELLAIAENNRRAQSEVNAKARKAHTEAMAGNTPAPAPAPIAGAVDIEALLAGMANGMASMQTAIAALATRK